MNIGKAAAASGVSAKMIRYYEASGLIEAVERTAAGYRNYSQRHVETLSFIRRARNLGFSVEQMHELLALWRDQGRASADVKRIALQHVAELQRKAEELQQMSQVLTHLADNCQGDSRPDCPIISGLAQPPQEEEKGESRGCAPRFGALGPKDGQQSQPD